MRKEFSKKVKGQAYDRAQAKCQRCLLPLQTGYVEYDHVIAAALGGEATLDNCEVLCRSCHAAKTKGDVGRIAKTRRQRARHIGAHKSRNPMPGGRQSKWKKKMDGSVVRRD